MADNWYNLAKNATDPQTIGEAIDSAIDDHNNDPTAHMEAGEVLDIHRENPVIDHPAESVVNDKIEVNARGFVAIVDPASDENFDTIEGAIAYAVTVGGGSIYIVPGTHYLSGAIVLPTNIYLVGSSALTTIISGGHTSGEYFSIDFTGGDPAGKWGFENIAFDNLAGGIIYDDEYTTPAVYKMLIINCINLNDELLVGRTKQLLEIVNSSFQLTTSTLISQQYGCTINNCSFTSTDMTSACAPFTNSEGSGVSSIWEIVDSEFNLAEETDNDLFNSMPVYNSRLLNNMFSFANLNTTSFASTKIMFNNFIFGATDYLGIIRDDNLIFGNSFSGSTVNNIQFSSTADNNITIGNSNATISTTDGTNNIFSANKIPQYVATTTTATALGFSNNEVVYQEPSATKTLTTTVPRAGTVRTLILKQTNTTAKTITFGTGFKTTGTLALGTTANRWFTLIFVSDGTFLIQIARSTAIA